MSTDEFNKGWSQYDTSTHSAREGNWVRQRMEDERRAKAISDSYLPKSVTEYKPSFTPSTPSWSSPAQTSTNWESHSISLPTQSSNKVSEENFLINLAEGVIERFWPLRICAIAGESLYNSEWPIRVATSILTALLCIGLVYNTAGIASLSPGTAFTLSKIAAGHTIYAVLGPGVIVGYFLPSIIGWLMVVITGLVGLAIGLSLIALTIYLVYGLIVAIVGRHPSVQSEKKTVADTSTQTKETVSPYYRELSTVK